MKPYLWFLGGMGLGLTLISLSQAGVPKRVMPKTDSQKGQNTSLLSEIRGGKVAAPDLDQDFEKLAGVESQFVESPEQQARLKSATIRRVSKPKMTATNRKLILRKKRR